MAKSDIQVFRGLVPGGERLGLESGDALYEIFHENTKLGPLTTRAYNASLLAYGRSADARKGVDQAGKLYTLGERRALPRVEARTELERTIAERRSIRAFSGAPLQLEELARLLFFTYGRTDRRGGLRAVASGGALYPLELYVVAFEVEGLEPGLYHYAVDSATLDVVTPGPQRAALAALVNGQGVDLDKASAAIVVSATFGRTTVKYLDRGYRLVLMEAGEAAQNLALLATSMGLGACLLGVFHDDLLAEFLDVDGVDEAPLLPILLGRPAPAAVAQDTPPRPAGPAGGI